VPHPPDPPDSLPAAVRRHAAVHPHAPWLFERPELDWTWISWQQAAGRLALPPGAAPDRPGPAAWLHHLQLAAVPEDDLAGAAVLSDRLGSPEIRDILVSGRPLSDPAEHRLLAWATLTGAAVLFEPDPAAYVPAAAWARPTVFQGTADEIAALRREAQTFRPAWPWRRPRLPFGRLRAILSLEPLPAEDEAFWTSRGTAILSPR
jgi:hypothetical protein